MENIFKCKQKKLKKKKQLRFRNFLIIIANPVEQDVCVFFTIPLPPTLPPTLINPPPFYILKNLLFLVFINLPGAD